MTQPRERSEFHAIVVSIPFLLVGGLFPALPAAAEDRTHVIEWRQPDGPHADGFYVQLGTQPDAYTTDVDLGPIAPDVDAIWRANLVLDAFTTYYLRIVAYNAAGDSAPSDEGMVSASICYPAFCDDDNECTADACDAGGCTNVALADGSACSDGMCVAGRCEPIQCLLDTRCDDGNVCNGVEFCAADGLCSASVAPSCGEPTACSAPTCDPVAGCLDVPLPDGTSCDDGRRWTKDDRCQAGVCAGTRKTRDRWFERTERRRWRRRR